MTTTMTETQTVRLYAEDDKAMTLRTLKAAFEEDPVFRCLFPGEMYEKHGVAMFERYLPMYQGFGMLYVLTNEEGVKTVAMWEPAKAGLGVVVGVASFGSWLIWTFGFKFALRFLSFFLTLEDRRHTLAPTAYHLCLLGTNTDYQGKGAGSKIIRPMLQKADEENVPCYLESSNPKNVPFYKRHGFVVVEELFPFKDWPNVEGQGPVMTLMTREPRPLQQPRSS